MLIFFHLESQIVMSHFFKLHSFALVVNTHFSKFHSFALIVLKIQSFWLWGTKKVYFFFP